MDGMLTRPTKGFLIALAGLILLLFTLGLLQEILRYFLIFGSLGMIIYGLYEAGIINRILDKTRKKGQ